jgi:hypothetical protein
MATIYKKKYPIPMPQGAEVVVRNGRRFARWTNAKNQVRTADVLDDGRIEFVSDCWYMRYRDAEGIMRRGSTNCREKQAAQKKLADVLADVEKVQTGIITASEKQIASHAERPLSKHVDDYLQHLSRKRIRGRKVSPMYRANLQGRLERLITECRWNRLIDIHALRHTFGTHLSASGVHPRTAMAAMRHRRMELTMVHYTDPTLLDVAGAVNALPAFGAAASRQVTHGESA